MDEEHQITDEIITRLGAALVDRNAYRTARVPEAVAAYRRLGDVDAAADEVAERALGPNWRQLGEHDD